MGYFTVMKTTKLMLATAMMYFTETAIYEIIQERKVAGVPSDAVPVMSRSGRLPGSNTNCWAKRKLGEFESGQCRWSVNKNKISLTCTLRTCVFYNMLQTKTTKTNEMMALCFSKAGKLFEPIPPLNPQMHL